MAFLRRIDYFRRVASLLDGPADALRILGRAGIPLGSLPPFRGLAPGAWWERAGQAIGALDGDPEALLRLVVELYLHAPGVDVVAAALDMAREFVRQGQLGDTREALSTAAERGGAGLIGPLDLRGADGQWHLRLGPFPPDTPIAQLLQGRGSSRSNADAVPRLARPTSAGTPAPLPPGATLGEAGVRSGDVLLDLREITAPLDNVEPSGPVRTDGEGLTPGALVAGRYRVTERGLIDVTRYSEVYQAEDVESGRRVALKLLRPGLEHSDEHVLETLRLPGVVRMMASFELDGQRVVVTAWVDGAPFPSGAPARPWSELLPLTRRTLEILRDIHALGVIHRDIKPGNILVGPHGEVTLIDFGVSMLDRSGVRNADSERTPGTLAYVAPELRGGLSEASPSSDLFALGVMLWRALTGQHPYPIMDRGGYGFKLPEPRWPEEIPRPPEAVLDWLHRLLALDRALRPASGAAALRDLREATRSDRGPAPSDEEELALRLPEPDPEGRLSAAALAEIFDAEDRIRQLRTRATRQVLRRAGTEPEAVRAELLRWLRAGVVELTPCGLSIDHDAVLRLEGIGLRDDALASIQDLPRDLGQPAATVLFWVALAGQDLRPSALRRCAELDERAWQQGLDELVARGLVTLEADGLTHDQTGGAGLYLSDLEARRRAHEAVGPLLDQANPRRLFHLTQAGSLHEAVATAVFQAGSALQQGHLREAVHLLGLAAQWSRGLEIADAPGLLQRLTMLALQTENLEVQRVTLRHVRQRRSGQKALLALLDSCIDAQSGHPERALDRLETLGPLEDLELEGWRHSVMLLAERHLTPAVDSARIAKMLSFSQKNHVRSAEARAWMEQGGLLYRGDSHMAAVRCFRRALALRDHPYTRIPTLVSLGAALLEAGRGADAAVYAQQALVLAREADQSTHIANAEWQLRRLGYQGEEQLEPDFELIRGVASMEDPVWLGMILLTEAAIAWRWTSPTLARVLARRAGGLLDAGRHPAAAVLAWGLGVHLGEPVAHEDRAALLKRAGTLGMPTIEMQVLALAGAEPPFLDLSRSRGMAARSELARLPEPIEAHRRLEILSLVECADILKLDLSSSQLP